MVFYQYSLCMKLHYHTCHFPSLDTYSGTEVITFDHSPTAKNGSNYTLQCYTSPHPNTSVLWLRNGTIISQDHTLKLKLIFGHSDGMYSCALTQDLLQHESGVINVLGECETLPSRYDAGILIINQFWMYSDVLTLSVLSIVPLFQFLLLSIWVKSARQSTSKSTKQSSSFVRHQAIHIRHYRGTKMERHWIIIHWWLAMTTMASFSALQTILPVWLMKLFVYFAMVGATN